MFITPLLEPSGPSLPPVGAPCAAFPSIPEESFPPEALSPSSLDVSLISPSLIVIVSPSIPS